MIVTDGRLRVGEVCPVFYLCFFTFYFLLFLYIPSLVFFSLSLFLLIFLIVGNFAFIHVRLLFFPCYVIAMPNEHSSHPNNLKPPE